jgi:hypothetical protein
MGTETGDAPALAIKLLVGLEQHLPHLVEAPTKVDVVPALAAAEQLYEVYRLRAQRRPRFGDHHG